MKTFLNSFQQPRNFLFAYGYVLLLIFSFFCLLHTGDEYEGGDKIAKIFTSVFTIWFSFPLFTLLDLLNPTINTNYDEIFKVIFILVLFLNIILNFFLSFWLFNKIVWLFKSIFKKNF